MASEEHAGTALIWTDEPGVAGLGSGLLIADRLVLTARHVVLDDNFKPFPGLKVRLQREGAKEIPCTVVWSTKGEDLALVRMDGDAVAPVFAYRFAALESSFPISSVKVTGYPTATKRGRVAYDYTVYGSLRREGKDALSFSVAWSDAPSKPLDWQGISGGSLFTTLAGRIREIFGVVQEWRKEFSSGKIFIAPASATALDGDFQRELAAAGSKFIRREINSSARQKTRDEYPFQDDIYTLATDRPKGQFEPVDFEIDASIDPNFENLKRIIRDPSACTNRVSPRQILPQVDTGYAAVRTYLQAPGGYGKSTFVRRTMAAAIDDGIIVFYLEARLRPEDSDKTSWDDIETLFESGTCGGGNYDEFRKATADPKAIIFLAIDGLNESVEDWAKVRKLLDRLKNNHPRVSMLISDRMNSNRDLPNGFQRATLLPVEVARIPDDQLRVLAGEGGASVLLSIPFFLDQFYRQRKSAEATKGFENFGRADIIGRYVADYAGAVDGRKNALQELAVEAYRLGSPQFSGDLIGRFMGEGPERLVGAGIVAETGKRYAFVHQLIHDYLAASWLAEKGKQSWSRENFDPITLQLQSFDALELAAELLGEQATGFVIAVYNWNYRAALDCIIDLDAGLSGKASPLPGLLKDAIFALRAEKKFDPFAHTARATESRLQDFRSSCEIDYAGVRSVPDLMAAVAERYQPGDGDGPLYARWKGLYLREDALDPACWTDIQDSPLIGWTAASVFRRPRILSAELVRYLIELFGAMDRAHLRTYYPGEAIRWRIVHVLGATDAEPASSLLKTAVADESETQWVRYGAVRSLVEQASRCANLEDARGLLAPIIGALPSMPPIVRKEICDIAILGGKSPSWWVDVYGEVLAAGVKGCADDTEKQMWQNAVDELNRSAGVK